MTYESLYVLLTVWLASLGFSYWHKSLLLRGMAILTGFIFALALRVYFIDPPDIVPFAELFSFVLVVFNVGLLVGVLFQE